MTRAATARQIAYPDAMDLRPALPRGAAEPLRVLVVDDDDALRESLATLLRDDGFVVDVAGGAGPALRAARLALPGVVLLDLGMPEIDGWEVIRHLRAIRPKRPPHIIVMSGFTDAASRRRAFDVGCDQYVVKEAGIDALVGAVRTYVLRLSS